MGAGMRGRSLVVLWIVVIVATVAALRGVPPLRERVRAIARSECSEPDYLAMAKERPGDAGAWLAALSQVRIPEPSSSELADAYAHASTLDATNPAPHFIFAVWAMPGSLLRRDELDALDGEPGGYKWLDEQALTTQERKDLKATEKALERASGLDPDNAAVDYLRACAALVDHRDEDASAHLRTALGKHSWDTYRREACVAFLQTALASLPSLEASSDAMDAPVSTIAQLSMLPRLLTGMAVVAQQAGNHAHAMLLRESAMHQAQLMLGNAYGKTDVLAATLAWVHATAVGLGEPPAESAGQTVTNGSAGSGWEDEGATSAGRVWPPGAVWGMEYFRQHGRDDLAEHVESQGPLMRAAHERTQQHREEEKALASRRAVLFRVLAHLIVALAGALWLVVLCGLAAVALRAARRPVRGISWSTWRRLVVVLGCLAAVAGTGLLWTGEPLLRLPPLWANLRQIAAALGAEMPPVPWSARPWGSYFVLIGLPLLLVSTLVVVLTHRRRHPDARDIGPVRQWLGTFLPVLLPLTALLCVLTLGMAIPASVVAARQAEVNHAIIHQGEATYYGLRGEG